jgi:hypothetical protein
MNILSRDKQIEILAALTEGLGIRATARVAGANRKTVAQLALQVGRGAAELHDRQMVGLRVGRLELDELWAFVGKKQKQVKRTDSAASHKHGAYRFACCLGLGRGHSLIPYDDISRSTDQNQSFASERSVCITDYRPIGLRGGT